MYSEMISFLHEASNEMSYSNLHNRWFAYAEEIILRYCHKNNIDEELPTPRADLRDLDFESEFTLEGVPFVQKDANALLNFIDDGAKEIEADPKALKDFLQQEFTRLVNPITREVVSAFVKDQLEYYGNNDIDSLEFAEFVVKRIGDDSVSMVEVGGNQYSIEFVEQLSNSKVHYYFDSQTPEGTAGRKFTSSNSETMPEQPKMTLRDWLEEVTVDSVDNYHNETNGGGLSAILGWWYVCDETGVNSYFSKESDALRFRLDYINRKLNP